MPRGVVGDVTRENEPSGRGRSDAEAKNVRAFRVLVVHGPNLNLLGEREPEVYGRTRLADIDRELVGLGNQLAIKVTTFQSNSEGDIISRIQQARGKIDALLINPAGYTHTSVAIRDAIIALE